MVAFRLETPSRPSLEGYCKVCFPLFLFVRYMLCYNILSHLPWILVNFSLDSTHNSDSSVGLSTGTSVATGDRGGSGWCYDCCYTHDKVLLVRFPGRRQVTWVALVICPDTVSITPRGSISLRTFRAGGSIVSSTTNKIGWAVNALFPKPQTVSIAPGGPVPLRTLRAGSSVV